MKYRSCSGHRRGRYLYLACQKSVVKIAERGVSRVFLRPCRGFAESAISPTVPPYGCTVAYYPTPFRGWTGLHYFTFRRKKEKLRGGWVQSANFTSECARKLLIL